MQIINTIVLVLILGLSAKAQPEWPPVGEAGKDFNLLDSKNQKTGLWYRTYSDGGLYYSGHFEKDRPKPGSTLYYYHDNGRMMAEHAFRGDGNIVDARHYFKSGKLQSKGKYINQKKDSTWTFMDEQGRIRSVENFETDSLHGESLTYYPDGQLLKKQSYNLGTPSGPWEEYYADGSIRTQGSWVDGKYDGEFSFFFANGQLEAKGKYSDGMKDGQWLYYTSLGQLEMQVLYENGEQLKSKRHHGELIEYHPSGIPKLECTYKNGELDGIYTEYYDQGEWIREQQPITQPGMQIEFIEKLINRQPSKECEYVNGKLKGEVLYFDENGKLTKKELYENGVLVETTPSE